MLVDVIIGESALVLGPRLEPTLSFDREGGETDTGGWTVDAGGLDRQWSARVKLLVGTTR